MKVGILAPQKLEWDLEFDGGWEYRAVGNLGCNKFGSMNV